ncbi:unnamed protein product [Dovyalis caffra]|uniref:Uncharacterized protein n=1 Tax=Dovyalis caffra TaxID=77055 RepID=A0AAV1RL18_9ROSI|nr:unnamed protein product [Dovyalis caffra]
MQCQNDNNDKIPSPKHHQQGEEGYAQEEEEDFLNEFQCSVCLMWPPFMLLVCLSQHE